MTVIRDSFDPQERPHQVEIQDLPDQVLKQLVVSGSREAAQELMRRKGRDG